MSRATSADAEAIAIVKAEGWRTTYRGWLPPLVLAPLLDERQIAAEIAAVLIDDSNVAIAARAGDGLIGFALCLTGGHDEPYLDSLHVLPGERSAGIGRAMLRRLGDELTARGHRTMTLTVVEQNYRARRLYERLGAAYVSTDPAPWAPEHIREAHYRWEDLQRLRHATKAPNPATSGHRLT
jgi:ribosomal protein S18 acetylase RimI-like enzyme